MTPIIIIQAVKGGPGSGNWGHRGIPGKVGGSSPRGAGLSPTSGKDWLQRYEKRTGKKHPIATKKPTRRGGTPGSGMQDAKADEMLRSGSGEDNWKSASAAAQTKLEDSIVNELASLSGVSTDAINDILGRWILTSNDHNPEALSLQEAASEEFNVPLSDWQKENIAAVNDKVTSDKYGYGGPVKGSISRREERVLLRAMYTSTQKQFSDEGYEPGDTVSLFRGVAMERKGGGVIKDSIATYTGSAMESWSSSRAIAKEFADDYGFSDIQAIVSNMQVPIENILSVSTTGLGCLGQAEFVVFGSIPGDASIVYAS